MNPLQAFNLPIKPFFKHVMSQSARLSAKLVHHFPNFCVLCQAPVVGRQLCHSCIQAIQKAPESCFRCAEPLETTCYHSQDNQHQQRYLCGRCQKQPPYFNRVIAGGLYLAPLSGLLQQFKFHQRIELTHVLGHILLESIQQQAAYSLPRALIAVPLHHKRLRQRGYNQAQLIAEFLSHQLDIPLISRGIYRDKMTTEQSRLTRAERKKNLRGAFKVETRLPQQLAIVDDVITTGSTSDELARMLMKQHATRVDIWCVAKTPQIK